MNQDDANNETDFHLCKAQVLSSLKPYAALPSKVYALLSAASDLTTNDDLLRQAFEEIFARRNGGVE